MALSPLWRRRWAVLRRHRAGLPCAVLFGVVLLVSLAADLLANDHPLLLCYQGRLYAPVAQKLPETMFGAAFLPTEADYGDPAVRAAIAAHGWAVWAPIPYGPESIALDAGPAPAPPSARHWLGTDGLSRDVAARLLYGLRGSLLFGFAVTLAGAGIGLLAGAAQGYFGGLTDLLMQRFTEIWSGLPQLFLLMILASLFAPGFGFLLLFFALFGWMYLANLVRAEFLRARRLAPVRAARALGLTEAAIIRRHVLPNALLAVLTFLPFLLADSVTLLAALSFLGLGLPPEAASLGELVAQARDNLAAPWLGVTACVALGGLLLLLVGMGAAMRDALDPRRAP